MAQKTRVGIIGMGTIGNVHAAAYQANADACEIVALSDMNERCLAEVGKKYGVTQLHADWRELVASDKVDAVSVGTPNALHMEIAVAALDAGKHVLLEKPVALDATQAAEIVAAAERSKAVIQVGMMWRQKPQSQVLRQYVVDGAFGEIYHMRCVLIRRRGIPGLGGWFTTRAASGGGPMIDLGVHWFDLAMWLSGLWQPTRVSARVYDKFGPRMKDYRYVSMWAGPPRIDGTFDVEDYATGFARFADKATMSFEIAWAANAESESFVEILGEQAGARITSAGPLTLYTEHGGHVANIAPQFDERVNPFEVQARKFLAACRGEGEPAATIQQGHTVMKLIDAIYASSRQGREVEIA